MPKTPRGFTIVELLIVIVVIAILAAISIVAYNGIQQRARNSERISTVNQIRKGLEMHFADKGFYPNIADLSSQESSLGGCNTQPELWGHCDRLKTLADALAPYVIFEPTKLSSSNPSVGTYLYRYDSRTGDNNRSYALGVMLEGSDSRAVNDDGFDANMYEVGQNPKYCRETYSGSGTAPYGRWFGSSYSSRCPNGP